jgi:CRISPR/Cas system-associated exonuclease Cas4 (RecB family)
MTNISIDSVKPSVSVPFQRTQTSHRRKSEAVLSVFPQVSPSKLTLDLKPRDKTYLHPSWLAKALSGDRQCLFSLHIQANYQIPKQENGFDAAAYQLQHQSALTLYVQELREDGFTVYSEDENSFWYTAKTGAVISAKPDIVALRDDVVWVPDIKTGKELRAADIAQVKLYMALIPSVGLHGVQQVPVGQLVHQGDISEISPDAITPKFKQEVGQLVQSLSSSDVPSVTPSFQECRWCPIRDICPSKAENVVQGSADWL